MTRGEGCPEIQVRTDCWELGHYQVELASITAGARRPWILRRCAPRDDARITDL
jgi:hypothetical protein